MDHATSSQTNQTTQEIQALCQKAETLFKRGQFAESEAICGQLFQLETDQESALLILGAIRTRQNKLDEAIRLFHRGTLIYPQSPGFHMNLGRILLTRGQHEKAVAPLTQSVLLMTDNQANKNALLRALHLINFHTFDADIKQAMVLCLKEDSLSHGIYLRYAWPSFVKIDPAMKTFVDICNGGNTAINLDELASCLNDDLLTLGLRHLIVCDAVLEHGLTALRRHIAEQVLEKPDNLENIRPFLYALAQNCFLNEYAFAVSSAEEKLIAKLKKQKLTDKDGLLVAAVLGCYTSLSNHPDAKNIDLPSDDQAASAMVKVLITEPLKEQALRDEIPSLTGIDDEISKAVRQQYEENPYPRWSHVGGPPLTEEIKNMAKGKNILVAGCGTGREPCEIALLFPYANVTAIDLSLSSISYGLRKSKELGITNIKFGQADILRLHELNEQYDMICSSGVLHHMKDPIAGWQSLCDALKPGGFMKICLYSTVARRHLAEMRKDIAANGYSTKADDIRAFREYALKEKEKRDAYQSLMNVPDFYSISQCRDLLFHVQEHTYTIPEIGEMLETLSLKLRRMDNANPNYIHRYHEKFPDNPERDNLDLWQEFENETPNLFAAMYVMWLQRQSENPDFKWIQSVMRV